MLPPGGSICGILRIFPWDVSKVVRVSEWDDGSGFRPGHQWKFQNATFRKLVQMRVPRTSRTQRFVLSTSTIHPKEYPSRISLLLTTLRVHARLFAGISESLVLYRGRVCPQLQGFLAHNEVPSLLGPPKDPRKRPTVGS